MKATREILQKSDEVTYFSILQHDEAGARLLKVQGCAGLTRCYGLLSVPLIRGSVPPAVAAPPHASSRAAERQVNHCSALHDSRKRGSTHYRDPLSR